MAGYEPRRFSPEELLDMEHTGAAFRLTFTSEFHPELRDAEAQARIALAAAIIKMDAAEGIPGRHNLDEQVAVERATQAYAQALADLVRGEKS